MTSAPRRPRVLVVEHEPDAGPGRLAAPLRAVADLDVRRPSAGDALPAGLAGYAGLVVLGGAVAAWEDDAAPWLPATRGLLAAGVAAAVPTLGICLGAQLLALATGGTVRRGGAGPEIGVVPVTPLPAATGDPLLGAAPSPFPAAQFHQDAITALPPGAVLLAAGERYPHQAFRLGPRAWGLQYHPEVTGDDFAAWLRDGHGTVTAAGLQPPVVAAGFAAAEPALAALAAAHGAGFGGLLAGGPPPAR